MNCGVLIFAHNSRDVDYALMSIVAGSLAKQYLNVPVSLVTDKSTIDWLKESDQYSKAESLFDQIILVDRPNTDNSRRLNDGDESKTVPFINANRSSAWDLTPYDRTLLIDSDYLIFSDTLSEYWNYDSSFMISSEMNDLRGDRKGILDSWVSDEGIPLYWATTIMFTKNQESKLYFDLVKSIKENYQTFAEIYRFDSRIYRNDIAFSIAKHTIEGFVTTQAQNLPPILTSQDKDLIAVVCKSGLTMLIRDTLSSNMILGKFSNRDIHVMNKQAIVRSANTLLEKL
jgi:hypothetical protein